MRVGFVVFQFSIWHLALGVLCLFFSWFHSSVIFCCFDSVYISLITAFSSINNFKLSNTVVAQWKNVPFVSQTPKSILRNCARSRGSHRVGLYGQACRMLLSSHYTAHPGCIPEHPVLFHWFAMVNGRCMQCKNKWNLTTSFPLAMLLQRDVAVSVAVALLSATLYVLC